METEVRQLPLTDRAWAWFEANRKQALWGALAVVVAAMLAGLFIWRHSQKERNAGEALSLVVVPRVGGAQRTDAAQAYAAVANDYTKTPAAGQARLLAGATFFADGKYEEARVQFERFIRENRDQRFMGQALLGIAACLEALGKTNEAVAAYKNLVDTRPGDLALPQAKFSLADLYEAQGKPELARGYFEELMRPNPYNSLGSEAGIRLEELYKKHPELVPAPMVLTNTPVLLTNLPSLISNALPASNKIVPLSTSGPPVQIEKP